MNLFVLIPVILLMIGLKFLKPNMIVWFVAWWLSAKIFLTYGVIPPLPSSIINMFMLIITIGLMAYTTASSERLSVVMGKITAFLTLKKYHVPLVLLLIAIPLLAAINTYRDQLKNISAPVFGRTVHPAPPTSITFKGKKIDIIKDQNPYRKLEHDKAEEFKTHVKNGQRVYVQNCMFCHGDNMDGHGMYAHALNPKPTNFQDATTIAMLTETFLFWRIAKGGPGLPEQAGYWETAMPAWEKFLTEEEIWDVILYLYDFTGSKPRATGEHHE